LRGTERCERVGSAALDQPLTSLDGKVLPPALAPGQAVPARAHLVEVSCRSGARVANEVPRLAAHGPQAPAIAAAAAAVTAAAACAGRAAGGGGAARGPALALLSSPTRATAARAGRAGAPHG